MNLYYSSYHDSGHGDGGYYPNSYDSSSNFASYYDANLDVEAQFFDKVPAQYYTSYDYLPPQPTISYSAFTSSHSDLIRIDPYASYSGSYDPRSTRFVVSYSKVEMDEDDFEEYDPTPYGGGYDPSLAYGKPLPPSAEICYPHSTRVQDAPVLGGVGDIIPGLPRVKAEDEQARKPDAGSEIEPALIDQEVQNSSHQTEEDLSEDLDHCHEDHEESKQSDNDNSGYSPWGGYGGGFQRMAPMALPGCGLDAWDICDGISGYWPCLSRDRGKDYGAERIADTEHRRWNEDRWQGTVDYLFGSTDPYAERSYDSQVRSGHHYVHAQERQSEGKLWHKQVEYEYSRDSNSW